MFIVQIAVRLATHAFIPQVSPYTPKYARWRH